MLLFQQTLILFLLILVGLVSRKTQLITDEVCHKLSAIVVYIANPALILSSGMGGIASDIGGAALAAALGLACALFAAVIAVGYLLPPVLRAGKSEAGVYRVMTSFSNIGFMGLPLVSAVYGGEAVLYMSLFLLPYNVLIYTYGIKVLKRPGEKKKKFHLGQVLNIGVIACIATVALHLLRLEPPAFIGEAVRHLSGLSAPLSMMVIGASLVAIDFKRLLTDVRLLAFSAVKLLVIPIAAMLVVKRFIPGELLRGVCLVVLATPVGSMTAMLAREYGSDYELAAKGVALTTLLSVVTIPLVSELVR
ncbi:MAG: AEC family transporter [Oscillospiraceae bacterium]|jgi:predicted permease|nr:AEC family transporter [Oscillospiraceae bacterium]